MIPFNKPVIPKSHKEKIDIAVLNKICGGGNFTKECEIFFQKQTKSKKALLTPSCTAALEMSAMLLDIKKDDEIIMPSFTFVSTANAFVLRGAKIVFVDINPKTMNIDEKLIEQAISKKTKAIVPVHYAGISCNMDKILQIARNNNLAVIEDAAQGANAFYKNQSLGTFGDFGTFSFHETKNYTSGEGGMLLINNDSFIQKAEILRDKGTNRAKFLRGEVDKYSWVSTGSSYILSELNAAYLSANLDEFDNINQGRLASWQRYYDNLYDFRDFIELPFVPKDCRHNAHIFYIKTKDIEERTKLSSYLKENDIITSFHYVPLHSSIAGKKFGEFIGQDVFTTKESQRLLRLPMFYGLKSKQVDRVCEMIKKFYT